MFGANLTIIHPTLFILGIPVLEQHHIWLSIPFRLMYITSFLKNGVFILVLRECTLHGPMYVFLSMLSGTDIFLSPTTVPNALVIFWFHDREIPCDVCITQIFLCTLLLCVCWGGSGILLDMTFDCYVAVCTPLRYSVILTPIVIGKMALAIWGWSLGTIFPIIFLLKRLSYCRTNSIPQSCCEHIGVARLACDDIIVNIWYGFSVPMASVLVDVALIGISYTLVLQAVFRLPFQDASTRLSIPVALTLESPLLHTFIFHITLARTFPTMYIFFFWQISMC